MKIGFGEGTTVLLLCTSSSFFGITLLYMPYFMDTIQILDICKTRSCVIVNPHRNPYYFSYSFLLKLPEAAIRSSHSIFLSSNEKFLLFFSIL